MNMLKRFAFILIKGKPEASSAIDQTIYNIETALGEYCGKIIYQDDMMIKLQSIESKAVKILKANIKRISIVELGMVQHDYQRRKV